MWLSILNTDIASKAKSISTWKKNCIKGMIHFKFFYKAVPFKNFIVNSDMFMKMSLEKYGQRALKNLPYPRSEV